MREILFRGRTEKGEWVYGDLISDQTKPQIARIGYMHFRDGESKSKTRSVLSKTVGQYTGLTDKNGTKIFEGDIVKFCKGLQKAYCVEFDSGRFVLTNSVAYSALIEAIIFPCEVVGNIHENPELLNGKDD